MRVSLDRSLVVTKSGSSADTPMSDHALKKARRWTETAPEVPLAKRLARESAPEPEVVTDGDVMGHDAEAVDPVAESGARAKGEEDAACDPPGTRS
jgi:hypothetical protein